MLQRQIMKMIQNQYLLKELSKKLRMLPLLKPVLAPRRLLKKRIRLMFITIQETQLQ